jgi:hypothetical protein
MLDAARASAASIFRRRGGMLLTVMERGDVCAISGEFRVSWEQASGRAKLSQVLGFEVKTTLCSKQDLGPPGCM